MASDKKMFAILALGDAAKLASQIQLLYPETSLLIGPDKWLLVGESSLTTTELSNKLGITGVEQPSGVAMVLSVGNYFGRAPATIWEWIVAKMGGMDGAAG